MQVKEYISSTKHTNRIDIICEVCGYTERVNLKDGQPVPECPTCNPAYKKVDVQIRWHQLFEQKMPPALRRERWAEWKEAALAEGEEGSEMVDYWVKDYVEETCCGCLHRDNDWCKYGELPCSVNPILTIQQGIIGMACCGAGYEAKLEQGDLFK